MPAILALSVITDGTAVVYMLGLLSNKCLMCRSVQTVTAASVLLYTMIFEFKFRERRLILRCPLVPTVVVLRQGISVNPSLSAS